ncbi:MAG TPA: hypothetical protein VIN57_03175 [Magnetovibrio sp.]
MSSSAMGRRCRELPSSRHPFPPKGEAGHRLCARCGQNAWACLTFFRIVEFSAHFNEAIKEKKMAALKTFVWSLGSDNLPLLFILLGAVMLTWVVFLGDVVIQAAG